MELRQLEAFVAVASELHFGRAAERLHLAQPTLSELVRRLERELGTPLFLRTTRRVDLTAAGVELLGRAKVILDDVASATAAVRRMARGEAGSVLMGITPPVATILAPHLRDAMIAEAPEVELVVQRMWLPELMRSVAEGSIDVALTCGVIPQPDGVVGEVFCGEPLLVALRKDHRLAAGDAVTLADLAHDVLGVPSDSLFPAWALAQRQALATAGITPPSVVLAATDLAATAWTSQPEIEWVLMTRSILAAAPGTVALPVTPQQLVSLHPAVESRSSPDCGGGPIRTVGPHGRGSARLARPTRSPAPPGVITRITPRRWRIDRRNRSVGAKSAPLSAGWLTAR